MTRDEQIAALLEAGATQEFITQRLGASNSVIRRVRAERCIPLPPGRAKRPRAELDALEAQAIAMMLAGAGSKEIYEELRLSLNTIARLRRELNLPAPQRDRWAKTRRTVKEALKLHCLPFGNGHVQWTGPMAGRMPELHASGCRYNARHVTFEAHHGRPPVGQVVTACGASACIAGAHLTDAVMRGTATAGSSS